MTANNQLLDELEAVNSIYNVDTLVITSNDNDSCYTTTTLTLPDSPFSFIINFPPDYPDVPPQITGTHSTGPNTRKGEGESALKVLRDALGDGFTPGQVCLFDLIEEVSPLLLQASGAESTVNHDAAQHAYSAADGGETALRISTTVTDMSTGSDIDTGTGTGVGMTVNAPSATTAAAAAAATTINPTATGGPSNQRTQDPLSNGPPTSPTNGETNWILSTALLSNKSSFVARALHVVNPHEATTAISDLVATNKKVAGATHNITAWRIRWRKGGQEVVVQDFDDDGETAAGGRVLHLMQLMDVWDVVVVVSRWYGGVKLGPDRFRCINTVAREALVKGGFAKEEQEGEHAKKKKGGRKK